MNRCCLHLSSAAGIKKNTFLEMDGLKWERYGLDDRSSIPGRDNDVFLVLTTSFRPILGATQPPIKWIPSDLYPGGKTAGA
jgi:hypothetical protein